MLKKIKDNPFTSFIAFITFLAAVIIPILEFVLDRIKLIKPICLSIIAVLNTDIQVYWILLVSIIVYVIYRIVRKTKNRNQVKLTSFILQEGIECRYRYFPKNKETDALDLEYDEDGYKLYCTRHDLELAYVNDVDPNFPFNENEWTSWVCSECPNRYTLEDDIEDIQIKVDRDLRNRLS